MLRCSGCSPLENQAGVRHLFHQAFTKLRQRCSVAPVYTEKTPTRLDPSFQAQLYSKGYFDQCYPSNNYVVVLPQLYHRALEMVGKVKVLLLKIGYVSHYITNEENWSLVHEKRTDNSRHKTFYSFWLSVLRRTMLLKLKSVHMLIGKSWCTQPQVSRLFSHSAGANLLLDFQK